MTTILTGPVQTGKTTTLRRVFADVPRTAGVVQPEIDGRRHLVDLATGTKRVLEAPPDAPEAAVVRVGRFAFSAEAFAWARERLRAAAAAPAGWVIVDEVGPLELRGMGLAPALDAVLECGRTAGGPHVLLVIRAPLLVEARAVLGLAEAPVVRLGDTLPGGVRLVAER
ncbi:MAG: nucleoside-triphosphatase [Bacteroidota bacterium]